MLGGLVTQGRFLPGLLFEDVSGERLFWVWVSWVSAQVGFSSREVRS